VALWTLKSVKAKSTHDKTKAGSNCEKSCKNTTKIPILQTKVNGEGVKMKRKK
jgi:hypothetical protein